MTDPGGELSFLGTLAPRLPEHTCSELTRREPAAVRPAVGGAARSTVGRPRLSLGSFSRWLAPVLTALFLCLSLPVRPAFASSPEVPTLRAAAPTPTPATARPSDHPEAREVDLPPLPDGFSTVSAGWIDFAYHPSIRGRIEPLLAAADRVRSELSEQLGQNVLSRVHVRIGRTTGEMRKLAPRGIGYPEYASGVAFSEAGIVLLTEEPRYPGEQHDLLEVFRHELAHVALSDAVDGKAVPRWFNEGFAVHASGEAVASRLQTLWTATLAGTLLPLKDLTATFPADATTASVAYAEAADLLRYLLRSHEAHRFRALIERVRAGESFERALGDAYATDLASFEYEWRQEVARRYTFWPVLFSGTTVWAVGLVLIVWAYRRRKRLSEKTLARWAVEEAAEDARRAALARMMERPVHIVLAQPSELVPSFSHPSSDAPPGEAQPQRPPSRPDVPKVEHDGHWHTLH